jgi:hypothetical protein
LAAQPPRQTQHKVSQVLGRQRPAQNRAGCGNRQVPADPRESHQRAFQQYGADPAFSSANPRLPLRDSVALRYQLDAAVVVDAASPFAPLDAFVSTVPPAPLNDAASMGGGLPNVMNALEGD